jgi:hypothetical protein
MLGLQNILKKKKKKKLLQSDVAQHDWISQNLDSSPFQSCCATSLCKCFFYKIFRKPSIPQH